MRLGFQLISLINIYAAVPIAHKNSSDWLTTEGRSIREHVFVYPTEENERCDHTWEYFKYECEMRGHSLLASRNAVLSFRQHLESPSVGEFCSKCHSERTCVFWALPRTHIKKHENFRRRMKKRRAENVAEMPDYDHFRAKFLIKNSLSRLNTTKYLESVIPSIFRRISCRKSTYFEPRKIKF